MRNIRAIAVAVTCLFAGTVGAQTGAVCATCADSIERYFPNLPHMGGAVHLYPTEHLAQVSLECRTAFESTGPGNRRMGWGGTSPRPDYMGLRQIVATIEALGYTNVREIEFEGSHYEIEATNSDGVQVEIYVDAVTGKVLKSKRNDS
ncbi:PepSY domain-containing protein [Boseongicola aestuarii]|uniref:Peptidase propeptide and YPEB domain protein n=1 Tax=Boseongicola aestuarii TaxID=1470561 RepID=A0A238IU68_9RHOB|nr:PepSY domain-containing protein [Boseongicola aestuarii]SMX21918.1 Peptidase propeptide and YPEB domain protein [Boseongicola aestuarii]